MREITVLDRSIAFAIFGLALSCYLFTFTGYIQDSDGLSVFATAESIVRRGEVDSNQLLWMGLQQGSYGPDGELYSRKGMGEALLALPLLWVALRWPAVGLVQTALLLNPLLTAWTAALIYRTGRRLEWSRTTAGATALIFALATLAWPYTQTFFSEPVCAWGLFAAAYGLLAYSQTGRKRYLLGAGLAWSFAYLARSVNLITLPLFFGALIVMLHRWYGRPGRAFLDTPFLRTLLINQWRPLVAFGAPIVLAGCLSLWWNWVRYGSVWKSGYVESETFSAPWPFGIFGLLIGPARGLLWYSPILVLGLVGVGWFWRNARWLLALNALLTLAYVLLYGKWYMWHGGFSWGPRFLVPLMPFLALLIGPAWEALFNKRQWGVAGVILVWAPLLVSGALQFLGLLIPFGIVQNWLAATVQPLFAPETFMQIRYSPLLLQWRFLNADNIHLAWWRAMMENGANDWQGVILPIIGVIISLLTLSHYRRQQMIGQPMSQLYGWLHAVILVMLVSALLIHYRDVVSGFDQRTATTRIEQLEEPNDVILFLRPAQTQQFANVYHGRLPVYGVDPQESLSPANAAWLQRIERNYRRVWLVSNDMLPEKSGWERPLRTLGFLLQENRLPNTENARLALYATLNPQNLTEAGLGVFFGDPAGGEINETTGWIRLNGYAFTTETHPGGEISVELRWQSLRPVAYNYHVFVHLLNERGEKLDQRDGQPVQWMRPISSWQPGEEIMDHYGFLLSKDVAPGNYHINVGLYDPINGQRLPVSAGPDDFAIDLGPIVVK